MNNYLYLFGNLFSGQNGTMSGIIIYLVFFVGIIYFLIIRPQKKERKKQEELMNSLAIGDSVLTTAGFYGTIIDLTNDVAIVEFGNNKNCRIPMQKSSIVKSEKPNLNPPAEETTEEKK